jgi:hypothetical protein
LQPREPSYQENEADPEEQTEPAIERRAASQPDACAEHDGRHLSPDTFADAKRCFGAASWV